jgi:topoisomerase IA-like protein
MKPEYLNELRENLIYLVKEQGYNLNAIKQVFKITAKEADTIINSKSKRRISPWVSRQKLNTHKLETEGYIYIIECKYSGKDLIKIGFSNNLNERLKSLKSKTKNEVNLLYYKKGTLQEEALLHKVFSFCSANLKEKEWYLRDQLLLNYIDKIK